MINKLKKSQALYSETVLIMVSIVFMGLLIFLMFLSLSGSKNTLECVPGSEKCNVPELNYRFPAAYIHSFLMKEVSSKNLETLGLDKTKTYYVKDLIYIDSPESQSILENEREDYIEETQNRDDLGKSMHDLYQDFSGDTYTIESTLEIITGAIEAPDLKITLSNNNYYFHMKTSEETITLIYFKPINPSSYFKSKEVIARPGVIR